MSRADDIRDAAALLVSTTTDEILALDDDTIGVIAGRFMACMYVPRQAKTKARIINDLKRLNEEA